MKLSGMQDGGKKSVTVRRFRPDGWRMRNTHFTTKYKDVMEKVYGIDTNAGSTGDFKARRGR